MKKTGIVIIVVILFIVLITVRCAKVSEYRQEKKQRESNSVQSEELPNKDIETSDLSITEVNADTIPSAEEVKEETMVVTKKLAYIDKNQIYYALLVRPESGGSGLDEYKVFMGYSTWDSCKLGQQITVVYGVLDKDVYIIHGVKI